MNKYASQSTNQNQLEKIYDVFYQNEKFFENFVKFETYKGYLIENNSMDELKKDIDFENIKKLIQDNKSITEMLEKIKEKEKIKKNFILSEIVI